MGFSKKDLLMVNLLAGDDGSVTRQHGVNYGLGDDVGLELGFVDVEGTVESQEVVRR